MRCKAKLLIPYQQAFGLKYWCAVFYHVEKRISITFYCERYLQQGTR